MLTRRNSIILTAKGLAALVASSRVLLACDTSGGEGTQSGAPSGGAGAEMDAVSGGPPVRRSDAGATRSVQDSAMAGAEGAREEPFEDAPMGGAEDTWSPVEDVGPAPEADTSEPPPELLDWDGFIEALSEMAEAQFSDTWDQSAYVEEVAALMKLLDLEDTHFQTLYDGYVEVLGSFPELATVHEGGHFEVATLEFDAGDTIPLHNHPDMTGVILCLSGETQVEGFNLLEGESEDGNLLLERIDQLTLTPGDHCTLTAERGNIHSLVATQFTQLLDVFTPPYDAEKLTRYRWYERSLLPYEGEDVFEAWEV